MNMPDDIDQDQEDQEDQILLNWMEAASSLMKPKMVRNLSGLATLLFSSSKHICILQGCFYSKHRGYHRITLAGITRISNIHYRRQAPHLQIVSHMALWKQPNSQASDRMRVCGIYDLESLFPKQRDVSPPTMKSVVSSIRWKKVRIISSLWEEMSWERSKSAPGNAWAGAALGTTVVEHGMDICGTPKAFQK